MGGSSGSVRLALAAIVVGVLAVPVALLASGAPPPWRSQQVAEPPPVAPPVLDLAAPLPRPSDDPGCADETFRTAGWRLGTTWRFRVGPGVGALGTDEPGLAAVVVSGATAWSTRPGPCGTAGTSRWAAYDGRAGSASAFGVDARGRATCPPADGVSVVDAGPLGGGLLGLTCSRWEVVAGQRVLTEADVRLDADRAWTLDPDATPDSRCTEAFDLRSVVTHELGHVLGLDDLGDGADATLTMFRAIPACTTYARSPGRGDLLGLAATASRARVGP